MDEILVQELISQKYIAVHIHEEFNYEILNYTPRTQFDKKWNEITLACRGLIRDKTTKKIIARGLPKFFNYSEVKSQIPNLPFVVYDKMDGSCGILYWHDNIPYMATRGSFYSDQAVHATKLLQNKYKTLLGENYSLLRKDVTYVFEIIYPDNKIVVKYDVDDIFLICAYETESGNEILLSNMNDLPFPKVKQFDGLNDMNEILQIQDSHNEGFVVRFDNGFRVKIKFNEYKRLHKIITKLSTVDIWMHLKDGSDINSILEVVPDEFFDDVQKVKTELENNFTEIEIYTLSLKDKYKNLPKAEIGKLLKSEPYSCIVFAMLNGHDYKQKMWEFVKPVFSIISNKSDDLE